MRRDHETEFRRLVKKYLQGKVSPAERSFLRKYYDSFDKEGDILSGLSGEEREKLRSDIKTGLFSRIAEPGVTGEPKVVIPVRRKQLIWYAAAAVMLILGVTVFLKYDRLSGGFDLVNAEQLTTRKGERKTVRLPDGSTVWLGPASRLEYPERFTGENRQVELSGEAFFEVAEDPRHPFIIQSGKVATRVLGTSFNIRAYEDQPVIDVTLVSGKVNVSAAGKNEGDGEMELLPNQRALFHKQERLLTKEDFPDAAQMLDRRDGKLVYKGAPMSTVIHDLNLHYNATIRLEGDINACTWYGEFNVDDPLENAFKRISLVLNITISKEEEAYVIRGRGCGEQPP